MGFRGSVKFIYWYWTKSVDICRASEVTQSHTKALHEEAGVAVNKIVKTKSPVRQVCTKQAGKEK